MTRPETAVIETLAIALGSALALFAVVKSADEPSHHAIAVAESPPAPTLRLQ